MQTDCPIVGRTTGGKRVVMAATRLLLAATGIAVAPGPVRAADSWEEAGSGAVAILPPPGEAAAVLGASLHCAEQRWRLLLRIEPGALPDGWSGPARMEIDGREMEGVAEMAGGLLAMAVSQHMLEALKAGIGMSFSAEGAASADFSLRGSRVAIEAVLPRCSPADMSAYTAVVLSDNGPEVEIARRLLDEEARLFRAATGRRPTYAAARLDLPGGKLLLFSSLCGSSSYYGQSGCSLFGHAAEGTPGDWRQVYNSEGLALHTDPGASSDGWPNLVTLSLAGAQPAEHWTWNGSGYELLELLAGTDRTLSEGDSEEEGGSQSD